MAELPNWWEALRGLDTLAEVYIVNLDLAGSSGLEQRHALTLKADVNELQELIGDTLRQLDFFLQDWSGDGLVALHNGRRATANECVEGVMQVLERFESFKSKHDNDPAWRNVNIRVGVVHGSVPWDDRMGRIIASPMNTAGHFQKRCPPGSILIDEQVFRRLRGPLQAAFERDTLVPHGNDTVAAWSYQRDTPPVGPIFSEVEADVLSAFARDGYNIVARAPATVYVVGDFDSIFGYPALVLPIPLFSYVGISLREDEDLIIDQIMVADERFDAYHRDRGLRLSLPGVPVDLDDAERGVIWDTVMDFARNAGRPVRGLRVRNLSLVPTRCGLGASSAFSVAFALCAGVMLGNDADAIVKYLGLPEEDVIAISDTPIWHVYKLAWAIENIFEGGASSGCGVLSSLLGATDGFPLITLSERRGFDRGFPFHFADGGASSSYKDRDFHRIRTTAYRTKRLTTRAALGLDYAILFTASRGERQTGDLIASFFDRTSNLGRLKVMQRMAEAEASRYDFRQERLIDLARRTIADDRGRQLPRKRFNNPLPSATRDSFVEWLAQSLGCISFAAEWAFLSFEEGATSGNIVSFLKHVDAYQSFRSALGVSATVADLLDYRSDVFQFEVRQPTRGGSSAPVPAVTFGAKLLGSGGGGDFLIMSPHGQLSERFAMLRNRLAVNGVPPATHFLSWVADELRLVPPKPKLWRLGADGKYEQLTK